MNELEALAALLAQLKGERYTGSLLVRAHWRHTQPDGERKTGLCIRQQKQHVERVCCTYVTGRRVSTLETDLLLGCHAAAAAPAAAQPAVPPLRHLSFSAEEITGFVRRVGDMNVLHTGNRPLVPGLFILERLATLLQPDSIDIRFHQPLWSGETLSLYLAGSLCTGFVQNRLCFKAILKGIGESHDA